MNLRRTAVAALLAAAVLSSCALLTRSESRARKEASPPSRGTVGEFRGLWVATLANIDWPSQPGLPAEESKAEASRILDLAVSLNLNAVLFQARPAADAFYESLYEPVSSFLTGAQGAKPEDWYDPLEFWVSEAHARGLALHVWMNPFRAGVPGIHGYAPGAPVRSRPELARSLGNRGYYWLDPGMPEAREYVLAVAEDLLRRYPVDGLVVDDYFYPYSEYLDEGLEFPDEISFERWKASGPSTRATADRADFRRESASSFLAALRDRVKSVRPGASFGISPFGIYRPGYPPGVAGKDAYAEIYADSLGWLKGLGADYMAPQLYWPVSRIAQSYPVLLGWWVRESSGKTPIWPSILAASPSLPRELRANEAVSQIMILRGMEPDRPGFVLYGARYLLEDPDGVAEALRSGPLAEPAANPGVSPVR